MQRAGKPTARAIAAEVTAMALEAVSGPEKLSGVTIDWRLQASDLRRLADEIREARNE